MRTRHRFKCPLRLYATPWRFREWDHWVKDRWRKGIRVCTWCGSMHPDQFMQAVKDFTVINQNEDPNMLLVGPADDHERLRFRLQHLSPEQWRELMDRYNTKRINIGYPGWLDLPHMAKRKATD